MALCQASPLPSWTIASSMPTLKTKKTWYGNRPNQWPNKPSRSDIKNNIYNLKVQILQVSAKRTSQNCSKFQTTSPLIQNFKKNEQVKSSGHSLVEKTIKHCGTRCRSGLELFTAIHARDPWPSTAAASHGMGNSRSKATCQ